MNVEEKMERGRMALSEAGRPDLADRLLCRDGHVWVRELSSLPPDDLRLLYRASGLVGGRLLQRVCEDCYVRADAAAFDDRRAKPARD